MKQQMAAGVLGLTVWFAAASGQGATFYVDQLNGNDANGGQSWGTAKQTIQAAVDAAFDGDEIVVTDGAYDIGGAAVYGMSNRVAITRPVTVRSVNGPAATSIKGRGPAGRAP